MNGYSTWISIPAQNLLQCVLKDVHNQDCLRESIETVVLSEAAVLKGKYDSWNTTCRDTINLFDA